MAKKFSFRKSLKNFVSKASQKIIKRPKKSPIINAKTTDKKILMFGWELPPFNSGGLGVACYELTKSMAQRKTDITFVLPKRQSVNSSHMKVAFADDDTIKSRIKYREVDSILSPYATAKSYEAERRNYRKKNNKYCSTLMEEVERYGEAAGEIAKTEKFDVIHAHDWLSFPAGIKAKKVSKRPFIAHVHAIEYDRCHEAGVNPAICAIEKKGLEAADKVIAVSNYTKGRIVKYYNIDSKKIEVVHNGISLTQKAVKRYPLSYLKKNGQKMVLFVGRITYQKGVDYLIAAAQKVLSIYPKAVFMIVGTGDMQYQIINQAAALGISDKVFFPGFLRNESLEKIYRAADVYVMPSVSEPFGLVALEALSNKVPIIVSRQSGVAEVVEHALKVNFWDVDDITEKIVAVLKNKGLFKTLSRNGFENVQHCTWDSAAEKCINIYNNLAIV